MIEDYLFLACFFGGPVAMVAAIGWLIVRALLERRRRRNLGWSTADGRILEEAVQVFPVLSGLAWSGVVAERGAVGGVGRSRARGGANPEIRASSEVCGLMIPVETGISTFVRHRSTGVVGRVVETFVEGAEAPEHWDWAFLSHTPDPTWDSPERAAALRALLRNDEVLYLTPRYAVVTRPGDVLSSLLERRADLEAGLRSIRLPARP